MLFFKLWRKTGMASIVTVSPITVRNIEEEFIPERKSDPDLDYTFKILATEYEKKSSSFTETYFTFFGDSTAGHGIKGDIPTLINMFPYCDEVSLATILKEETNLTEEYAKTVILCCDLQKRDLFCRSLNILKVSYLPYTPTLTDRIDSSYDKDIMQIFQEHYSVLLSDIKGVSGLEFENVIVAIDNNEYHLKQLVVDCVSRCTCNLTIVAFNEVPKVKKAGVLTSLRRKPRLNQ